VCSMAAPVTCLNIRCSDRLRAKATEHAILLAEPTFQTREGREAVVSALFEQQQPPAVFLARNAVLASFATGRQTSLVVDAGHEGTTGASLAVQPYGEFHVMHKLSKSADGCLRIP
jgi:actin-related protein